MIETQMNVETNSEDHARAGPLIAGTVVFALAWGGAAALAWQNWLTSSSWWVGSGGETVVSTPSVRAADRRLFLEDVLVVSAVVLIAAVVLILVARRHRRVAPGLTWALAFVGVLAWIGPITAPRIDEASIQCTNGREDQSLALRGWSWTRFSEIVVLTDPSGTRETTCP
jgi:cytochrome b